MTDQCRISRAEAAIAVDGGRMHMTTTNETSGKVKNSLKYLFLFRFGLAPNTLKRPTLDAPPCT